VSDRPTASRRDPFLTFWTACLAAATAAITVHPEFESDPFWHMTLARAVLANRSRTVPEPVALPAFSDPCVVPEWLWGVVTLGVHRFGPAATALFVALLAVGSVVAIVAMLRTLRPSLGRGGLMALSGSLAAMVLLRLRLRPEAAALVLLPAFMVVTRRALDADGPRQRRLGVALWAMELLWAQLHGSFVLAPAVFAILAAPVILRPSTREARTIPLAILGALVVGLTTSAFGLHLGEYVFGHASGDGPRHIVDWTPLRWEDFAPRDWLDGPYGGPYGAVVAAMAAAALLGTVVARRVFWVETALAALGVALAATGCRFLTMGAVLAAPLAAAGVSELGAIVPSVRHRWVAGAAFGAAMIGLQGRGMHLARGPIGKLGLAEGDFPLAAAEYLRRLPGPATSVLTSYDAGAPLGFWLPGRVRTFVDGRTPLYFDDTDYGLARDVFRDPRALAAAARRFEATAVVLPREAGVCKGLSEKWSPVVVEARFTTFVPRADAGEAALGALAPCGPGYLRDDACRDGGAALDADIARLSALRSSRFLDYLRAERILRCGGALPRVPELLPSPADAAAFRADRDRAQAAYLLRTGRALDAVEALAEHLRQGDAASFALAAPALASDKIPVARARELLEAAVDRLDDATPPDLRALLAVTCAEQRDPECARFNALRAAAGGSPLAVPTLEWLGREHPSARARADAAAWLAILRATPPAPSSSPASPPAPAPSPASPPVPAPSR
jgi:hypothetical protein